MGIAGERSDFLAYLNRRLLDHQREEEEEERFFPLPRRRIPHWGRRDGGTKGRTDGRTDGG